MKEKISAFISSFLNDYFVSFTCIIAAIISALYIWKGIQEQFTNGTLIYILMNILYIPFALIFKKKCFSYFYVIYSIILVFVIAFDQTFLYNNYTALFILCLVIMIKPKATKTAIIIYFITITIAFSINEEVLYHYFIHVVRSIWFIGLEIYVLDNNFERKKLILYEDEITILSQICDGKTYQKEVKGFSENTVYRKLKAARERNGNISKEQLIELFLKEYHPNENDASTRSPDMTAKSTSSDKLL